MADMRQALRQRIRQLLTSEHLAPTAGAADRRRVANEALALARQLQDRLLEAEALWALGRSRTPLVHPAEALVAVRQAEAIYRANDRPMQAAACKLAAARAYHDLGEECNAVAAAQAAIDEPLLPAADRAFACVMVALAQGRLGQLDSALAVLTATGLPLARRCGDPYLLAQALCARAVTQTMVMMVRRAPGVWQGLPGIAPSLGDSDATPAMIQELYEAAMAVLPAGERWSYIETSRLLLQGLTSRPELALQASATLSALAEAVQVADPPRAVWAWISQASVLNRLGNVPQAVTVLERALAVADAVAQTSLVREICLHLARLHEAEGDTAKSLAAHKRFTELQLRSAWRGAQAAGEQAAVGEVVAVNVPTLRNLEPAHVRRALRYIAEHLGEPIAVDDLVAHCGVSRRTLETAFKAARSLTIADFIKQRKLSAAARQLSTSDRKIREVATAVGYRSAAAFARDFRIQFGLPPTEWRQSTGCDALGPDAN